MASTLIASTAIMLSSLIAVLMTSNVTGLSSTPGAETVLFRGSTSRLALSIKFFSILLCSLTAFLLNVQSIRYYRHAGILINVPLKKHSPVLTPDYVGRAVNRGSYFWSLGLRAFYFSFPRFLWVFGPVPMFLRCFILVFLLYFLDIPMGGCLDDGSEKNDMADMV